MRFAAFVCLAVLALGAAPARADEAHDERVRNEAAIWLCFGRHEPGESCVGEPEKACLKRAQFDSSAAMETCAIGERAAWEHLLAATYRNAVQRLDDGGLAAQMKRSQAAWLRWRDAELAVTRDLTAGGTIQDTAVARRASQLTEARVRDLDRTGGDFDTTLDGGR